MVEKLSKSFDQMLLVICWAFQGSTVSLLIGGDHSCTYSKCSHMTDLYKVIPVLRPPKITVLLFPDDPQHIIYPSQSKPLAG